MREPRKSAFVSFVALTVAAVLAGCGGGSTSDTGSSGSSSALRIAYESDATSLDPGQVSDINTMHVMNQMYDGLVALDGAGEVQPSLATSWQISDDGLTYTFTLRDGVKFSDGSDLDADDVVFSFERMLDEKAPGAEFGPWPYGLSFFGKVSEVAATDATTVTFTLSEPDASILKALTSSTGRIVNSEVALDKGKDFASEGGGTGPYMLDKWARGEQLVLKRNSHYWGEEPKAESITWLAIDKASQRVNALQTNSADLIVNPESSATASLESSGYIVDSKVGPQVWWLGMDLTEPPLDNVLVRRAINHAVDNEFITNDILKGAAVPAHQVLAPGQVGHATGVDEYPYDPEKAKELLDEAGYADGFKINVTIPNSGSGMQDPVGMTTAIQSYLAKVGIDLKIEQFDFGTFVDRVVGGPKKYDMDMWANSFTNVPLDPAPYFNTLIYSKSVPPSLNTGYYDNPKVDKLLNEAVAETDQSKRATMYEEVSTLVNADAPWLWVDHGKATYVYTDRVTGFEVNGAMPFVLPPLVAVSVK